MRRINKIKRRCRVTFLTAFMVLISLPAFAINLAVIEAYWLPPSEQATGERVRMWAFVNDPGSCPPIADEWFTGPTIEETPGNTLTVNLRNCLTEPVSIVIPGQETTLAPVFFTDGENRRRVRSFTKETAPNAVGTYTFTNLKEGTYLYQSGSHPAKQVHMGLYGSLTVGRHEDATIDSIYLFSEIDPDLHVNAEPATPLSYKPKYYLINGKTTWSKGSPAVNRSGKVGETTQLRFLNAGLMSHIPSIAGQYVKLVAEDGFRYPYPKEQYTILLPAGKTIDALWTPDEGRNFTLYDRRLSLTYLGESGGGMIQFLNVNPFPWHMFRRAIQGQ